MSSEGKSHLIFQVEFTAYYPDDSDKSNTVARRLFGESTCVLLSLLHHHQGLGLVEMGQQGKEESAGGSRADI